MAADGSLRFDTKIDTSDFDASISTLEKALDKLTDAVERLSDNIVHEFHGMGSAATAASKSVDSIGESAKQSEAQVKSLKEQMDAISVQHWEDNTSDAAQAVPVAVAVDESAMNYDPSAMAAVFGEAAAEIHNYAEAVEQYGNQAGAALNKMSQEAEQAEAEISDVTIEGEKAYVGVKESIINAFKYAPEVFKRIPQEAAKELSKVPGIVKNAFSKASSIVMDFGKTIGTALGNKAKAAVTNLKSMVKPAEKASKSILKLSNMFKLMLIRMALRAAIQGVKEGLQNLVQYSSEANQSMSDLTSGMTYAKNSFATAFAPILSYVVPVLNTLINVLATALAYVNQFFSALGGATTFVKAKKVNEDYAKSLKSTGSAAKSASQEAKKALAPFDDLVQIQQQSTDSSGGGGSSTDPSQMFEISAIDSGISDFANQLKDMFQAGDWEGIGKLIGEKINEAVQSFTDFISWDRVGAKITSFVTAFTTMFNSLVAAIDWYAIGIMMGTGVNTLANTLYLLLTQIDWFMLGNALSQGLMGTVDTVDWELFGATIGACFQAKISGLLGFVIGVDWSAIGAAIAVALMGMINQIDWGQLGHLFAAKFNALFAAAEGFAQTFDWTGFGDKLAFSLSTFFQTFDWAGAGTAISDIVIGLLDALIAFTAETDWIAFGEGVATSIESIDWPMIAARIWAAYWNAVAAAFAILASFLGTLIADGVTAAKDYFQEKIEECGGNVVEGIFKGIIDAMSAVETWITNNVFDPFINAFKDAFGIHSPSTVMAEMGQYLWDGFCNGIKQFFSNPVSFIKDNITDPFINGIKDLLGIHSPSTEMESIGGYTVDGFNLGVQNGQSSTQSAVQSWASGITSWFTQKLGISSGNSTEAKGWANSTMTGFNSAVSGSYGNSQSVMELWAESIRKWFVASGTAKGVNKESWKRFADDVILAFAEEITAKHIDTQAPTETWAENIRKWFVGENENAGVNETSWSKFADQIINAFKEKIEGSHAETRSPMETWARNVREWFWGDSNTAGTGGMYQAFYNMAKRINEGFANGISDFAYMAMDAIRKWASEIMEEAEEEFDINSPSKEFYGIAEYVVKGFNNGLLEMADTSVNAAQKWLNGVLDVFDGVDIQVPIGLDIPNASSYFPRVALGTVIPPRAGEYALEMTRGSYDQEDTMQQLLDKMEEIMQTMQEGEDRPVQLTLNMTGNLASLARLLKPELDKETARKGVSLVVTGGT